MKEFINKLIASFDNINTGFSARKLSAFVAVITCVYLSIKLTDITELSAIITIWLGFALICLGIITMQQIIQFKTGSTTSSSEKYTETKTETTVN